MIIKKADWTVIREEEEKGLAVGMTNLVERVRTDLNERLSSYFRGKVPNYKSSWDENDDFGDEDVLSRLREYIDEAGINKNIGYPVSSGSNIYLLPITENLGIKVNATDEYHGGGEYEKYVMIDFFIITEEATEEDVDRLIEFVDKYLT